MTRVGLYDPFIQQSLNWDEFVLIICLADDALDTLHPIVAGDVDVICDVAGADHEDMRVASVPGVSQLVSDHNCVVPHFLSSLSSFRIESVCYPALMIMPRLLSHRHQNVILLRTALLKHEQDSLRVVVRSEGIMGQVNYCLDVVSRFHVLKHVLGGISMKECLWQDDSQSAARIPLPPDRRGS